MHKHERPRYPKPVKPRNPDTARLGANIAANLRAFRGDRAQTEFARLLGVPAASYRRYEGGAVPRDLGTAMRIAARCRVTLGSLCSPPKKHKG